MYLDVCRCRDTCSLKPGRACDSDSRVRSDGSGNGMRGLCCQGGFPDVLQQIVRSIVVVDGSLER